ncbi:AAA family ATPase [Geminocystis sp. NIES-3709]|uniref:phosphatase domain-containing protein n=1 Tax=Geminocystis sp. NIES-3709 TaxID=1617448 RepID=UPI0005FC3C6E|nr:AAA family ATPase [Geminocystis sp. NIES-3709]BAQ64277.1 3'-phosphatase [Geminocystis sp. NIES-3709]
MKKVVILQGLPASGKSTFAKNILLKEPGRWVRINKDLLREMAHASHWSPSNEKFIVKLRDHIILMALEEGKHVLIDDTNFGKNIEHIKGLVKGKAEVKINNSFLQVPVEECIKRDLKRANSVGKDVIMTMYNQFIVPKINPPEYNPNLPSAIIVDMDGTLAILHNRNPYDVSKCDQDWPNQPVLETIYKWQDSTNILVVSGRTDDGEELTEKWLQKYQVKYTNLYMRKTGDSRKDAIIKQEIYEQFIKDKYNIKFILDDRNQVVEMWRSLGLTVFQVAEGDF